ncbi:hypothetical protein M0804_001597 [Polistes exclamans]|nr:hypothetical protein M0804_001597 [Polistes exclamans]
MKTMVSKARGSGGGSSSGGGSDGSGGGRTKSARVNECDGTSEAPKRLLQHVQRYDCHPPKHRSHNRPNSETQNSIKMISV